jgi:hypothetical protein
MLIKFKKIIFNEDVIVIFWTIITIVAVISYTVNTMRFNEKIAYGTKVILKNDTLVITKYFPFLDEYTLSNDVKIDGEVLRKFKK